ncbi:type I restriction enzyme HsdR N-terminal domain-containing protein [Desulfobulbus rhabdoformis]|uniref:type I restriction endonuclease n=1 Tax=Desulfobulbus rhabdoformis TaxID=34032 RepID=UPI0019632506|nr:type I restriction endonuclease [Desulfobulbus rhabdoformis]MBM9614725.1 type I restriction enzyme HsdR N-terminal domain-containing protein [Desulfobulbus rhabdoformis]
MDFADKLVSLASRINKQKEAIQTEEAAKTAFVMPFIQTLGYDVFDPTEVVPEFIADVGSKKGEKIDYAIMVEGKPSLLIECKCCNADLCDNHAAQLRRYFHVTAARIGVLTNGHKYQIFADLDEPNIMDEKPFMEIDLLDLDEQLVPELKKLTKSSFELDQMLSTASNLKYTREIKGYLEHQLKSPDQDFVRLVLADFYTGMKTQIIIEQFTPLVKQAFYAVINDQINARLKSALSSESQLPEQNTNEEQPDEPVVEETAKGIVTTGEEMEGYYIVRAILRPVVDIERVAMRDTKSYCGILLDNNNRKPICRLHFNSQQKYIGIFDGQKNETRMPIDSLNELYDFTDQIRTTVSFYEG